MLRDASPNDFPCIDHIRLWRLAFSIMSIQIEVLLMLLKPRLRKHKLQQRQHQSVCKRFMRS